MLLDAEILKGVGKKIFHSMGSSPNEADIISKHLVKANLMGHDSHGVGMIPIYVKNFHEKILFPNIVPEVTVNEPSILVFNGKRGFGQSVAHNAMRQAIKRCKKTGLVLMGLNNCGHMGRIGSYGEQSTAAGLISIHFVNVTDRSPAVAPFGGSSARFGTNPICLAVPQTSTDDPLILDFATSKVAVGKIRVAINKNEKLPDGIVIDFSGKPSNDPNVMKQHIYPNETSDIREGAVLPMGGYKGFGLSFFCEIFGGILSGGTTIQQKNKRLGGIINNMSTIIIDPEILVENAIFQTELTDLIDFVKSSSQVDPDRPILVPGEVERQRLKSRKISGIEIDDQTFDQIINAAKSLNINETYLDSLSHNTTS